MGDVQGSIAVGKTRKSLHKPSWLTVNMIMVYTLCDSAIYRKAQISSESNMWKDVMMEEMSSLNKNDTWELSALPRGKKAIGCM